MRVLVAPDSFKGSMSAGKVCSVVGEALCSALPGCELQMIPVADGGEGTAQSFIFACGATKKDIIVSGPCGGKVKAYLALMGDTAVVESALACGLPLSGKANDPALSTTYGVGEMIRVALDCGLRKIVIGIGGSATNDGGIGCAAALGVKFYDKSGSEVSPDGYGMSQIEKIDIEGLDKRVEEAEITVLCDVENPLYGENGAAYVYAPQKGADSEKVVFLDNALRNLERAVKNSLGTDMAALPGAGAAGGMGYGLMTFLGANLRSGAKTVLDMCGFDEKANAADFIITGEGRFDCQSLMGKVPGEIISRADSKPVIIVCGANAAENVPLQVSAVFETNPEHKPFEEVLSGCEKALFDTVYGDVSKHLKKLKKFLKKC